MAHLMKIDPVPNNGTRGKLTRLLWDFHAEEERLPIKTKKVRPREYNSFTLNNYVFQISFAKVVNSNENFSIRCLGDEKYTIVSIFIYANE